MSITYEDLNDNERLAVQNLTARDKHPLTLGRAIELVSTRRVEDANAAKVLEDLRIEQAKKAADNEAQKKVLLIKQRKEAADQRQKDMKAGQVKEPVKIEVKPETKQDPIKPFESKSKPKKKK